MVCALTVIELPGVIKTESAKAKLEVQTAKRSKSVFMKYSSIHRILQSRRQVISSELTLAKKMKSAEVIFVAQACCGFSNFLNRAESLRQSAIDALC